MHIDQTLHTRAPVEARGCGNTLAVRFLLSAQPMFQPNRLGLALMIVVAGCGDDGGSTGIDPTDVKFGDTALVVVINPSVTGSGSLVIGNTGTAPTTSCP
jgi:hypothetical protein